MQEQNRKLWRAEALASNLAVPPLSPAYAQWSSSFSETLPADPSSEDSGFPCLLYLRSEMSHGLLSALQPWKSIAHISTGQIETFFYHLNLQNQVLGNELCA